MYCPFNIKLYRLLYCSQVEEEVEVDADEELSDMDDDELDMYIASKEEAELKHMLWTEMNK